MDNIANWLASASASLWLLLWVLGSALVYALGTHVLWLTRSTSLRRSLYLRWLEQVGRFVFFLGIPYLALGGWPRRPYQGLLSLDALGLVGLNEGWPVARWLDTVGTGLGLGLLTLLILILAWTNVKRNIDGSQLRCPPRPWWALLVDVAYSEVHWAFYRASLALVRDDVYAGAFLGLGLIYAEWAINPFWRQDWRLPSLAARRWLRATLALAIALLFLLTRNLWVCFGVHLLLELAFWKVICGPVPCIDAQDSPFA
jgi:hypothetical protein